MKIKVTVVVDLKTLNHGGGTGSGERLEPGNTRKLKVDEVREFVAAHALSAVLEWGGQYHGDYILFPSNIEGITAKSGRHFYEWPAKGDNT